MRGVAKRMTKWVAGGVFACMAMAVQAAGAPAVQFSATAVQKAPQRGEFVARMYVGSHAVRTEYERNGQKMIEIAFTDRSLRVMLFPQNRTYVEQRGAGMGVAFGRSSGSTNPCEGGRLEGASCKPLGREEVNGRLADKWEVTMQRDGKTLHTVHWIDVDRKLPLRENFADGTRTELQLVGEEKINGRRAEKWIMKVTRPDGKTMESTQWYDPELHITIREEVPGGYIRELRDIRVGPQPESLFTIPAGWRRVEMPQGQGGMRR